MLPALAAHQGAEMDAPDDDGLVWLDLLRGAVSARRSL